MKPHPKLRKTIKWGGAAVTVLLVVVWIGSMWYLLRWQHSSGAQFGIAPGQLSVGWIDPRGLPASGGNLSVSLNPGFPLDWSFRRVAFEEGWCAYAPLWCLVVLSAAFTCSVWRLDTLARRGARLNLCPKCNYDRAGIGAGAVCPECGDIPKIV